MFDRDTRARRFFEHDGFEHVGLDLPPARTAGERLDARLAAPPPHGVASGADEARALDRVTHADRVEQLGTAGGHRYRKPAFRGRASHKTHGVPPAGEQSRGARSGRSAAKHEDVWWIRNASYYDGAP